MDIIPPAQTAQSSDASEAAVRAKEVALRPTAHVRFKVPISGR